MNPQEEITRIRVLYTKGDSLRFTGHLDMQRLWERLLRRSNLPVRYSQGFHPRARMNLASALPLGFVSDAELLDFWMNEPLPIKEIRSRLSDAAPPGLEIKEVSQAALSEDALQVQMAASEFEVEFFDPQDMEALIEKVNDFLSQDTIMRRRRKKVYDLRPLVIEINVINLENGEPALRMKLKAEEGATGRPDEVLDQMGFQNTEYLVCRTKLLFS
jgi:radical SAM-linked protein